MINKNNDFDKFSRNINRGFKAALCIWVVWALICLSLLGAAIYTAIHFIGKFW